MLCSLIAARREGAEVVKVHGHGAVGVGTDAVAFAVLAVVKVLVLVSQNGQGGAVGQVVLALQCRHRSGLDVLVGQGQKRDGHADHFADLGAPEACAGNHDVRGDNALGRLDARDAPAGLFNTRDRGVAPVLDARGFRTLDQQLNGAGGVGQAVAGDMEPSQDVFLVQERVELHALCTRKDLAANSTRCGVSELPLQVRETQTQT